MEASSHNALLVAPSAKPKDVRRELREREAHTARLLHSRSAEKLYPLAPRVYVRPSARAPDLLEKLCVSVFSYTGPRASPQRGRSTVRRLGVVCCVQLAACRMAACRLSRRRHRDPCTALYL